METKKRPDRVTRLIVILGALTRLREAEFAAATNQGYLQEKGIEALKKHYFDLRISLTKSDRERIADASFEALCAARRIAREWDDEFYGHTTATVPPDLLEPKVEQPFSEAEALSFAAETEMMIRTAEATPKGVVTVNTINPVMEAAREAMCGYFPGKIVPIEGTETSLQLAGNPPSSDDLASMVRQLTEKIEAGTLPKGVIVFNRYCSWVLPSGNVSMSH